MARQFAEDQKASKMFALPSSGADVESSLRCMLTFWSHMRL